MTTLKDIDIPPGRRVEFGRDRIPPEYSDALRIIKLNTFQDLVREKVVRSQAALESLLQGAKRATSKALNSRETYANILQLHRSPLPDLRRYADYRAAIPNSTVAEADIFWRFARDIRPELLESVEPDTPLTAEICVSAFKDLAKLFFKDITIRENGIKMYMPDIDAVECRHLRIYRKAKLITCSSHFHLTTTSVQGNM